MNTMLGGMTSEQREELAQAYERGDGHAVSRIESGQLLNVLSSLPSGGIVGAASTIKTVKIGDKVGDATTAASVAEKAREAVGGGKKYWRIWSIQ